MTTQKSISVSRRHLCAIRRAVKQLRISVLFLSIFLYCLLPQKELDNSIFHTPCPRMTRAVVLLAVEQRNQREAAVCPEQEGWPWGWPLQHQGDSKWRMCCSSIPYCTELESILTMIYFFLCPPWCLPIISDMLSLRPSCCALNSFFLQLLTSFFFYYKAGTLERKSNLFQFSFYMEKNLAICYSC